MSESIDQFYERISYQYQESEQMYDKNVPYVNVLTRGVHNSISAFNRRDFFKVTLLLGSGKIHFANRCILIDRPALLFSNPLIPYAWEPNGNTQLGVFCIFNESFIKQDGRTSNILAESPFFNINAEKIYFLPPHRLAMIQTIFDKMMDEMQSDYTYKHDVLRNDIQLLAHEALKMQAEAGILHTHTTSHKRTAELFLELLDRQFPVDIPSDGIKLRSATDFATRLSVHVNHLNSVVKKTWGKTTSEVIADRLVREAHALLEYSTYNISEIAYGLGFENPSYFSNFYKKHTNTSPASVRSKKIS